jgi:hypothetical protein
MQLTENIKSANGGYNRKNQIIVGIIAIVLIITIFSICLVPPIFTDQNCIDYLSGHTPSKAENLFLSKIFEATSRQDYQWLATIGSDEEISILKDLRPYISTNYLVIGGDELSGLYDRAIQFENGTQIHISYWSKWPNCPDFMITEDEVFRNIKLEDIYIIKYGK